MGEAYINITITVPVAAKMLRMSMLPTRNAAWTVFCQRPARAEKRQLDLGPTRTLRCRDRRDTATLF